MKIALDISPLVSAHKYRGTGFYVKHLQEAFETYFSNKYEFMFFTDRKMIPEDVDIIHYPYFDPFSQSVPLFPKTATMVTVLDLIPILFPDKFPAGIRGNIHWLRQKFALQHIAGILTDSESAKEDIKRLIKVPGSKVATTYLAAGEQFVKLTTDNISLKRVREAYHLPEKFALYVGDVTWNKNLPRLVTAAIEAKIPLVMVGKALVNEHVDLSNIWNNDLQEVQKLAKENKNIIRLGFVADKDLIALYNLATVFVMPSLYEGFGLPLLEAMACGCPVIASREASLKEVVGDAAYVVDAYNTNSITKGLHEVFSSNMLQKSLSQKGQLQAKKFSWKKTAQATISAYEMALTR